MKMHMIKKKKRNRKTIKKAVPSKITEKTVMENTVMIMNTTKKTKPLNSAAKIIALQVSSR